MSKSPPLPRGLLRYGMAILAVGLGVLLRWLLVSACGELPPFTTFFLMLCLAALTLGGGPAAVVTVLSVLAVFTVIPASGRLHLSRSGDLLAASIALVGGIIVSVIVARWERSRQQLTAAAERRGAERERQVTSDFLALISANSGTRQLVEAAVRFFRGQSGCEAVGVRLKEGDDYPYYQASGFPEQFVQLENSLCIRDPDGKVQRDQAGNPDIACMCGNVICGRSDPTKPFFTSVGSFWTNDTTRLLVSTAEADRQGHTRNRCNGMGYESVALIPLGVGEQRLGLLQLNDRRKNRFTPEEIALWEKLAGYLAVALAKTRAEEALRLSEERFRTAFEDGAIPMALTAGDGELLRVNSAFCQMLGYASAELVGRNFADLTHPDDLAENHAGIQRLVSGEAATFHMEKRYIRKDGRVVWGELNTSFVRDAQGQPLHLVTHVQDITDRKQAELDQHLATEVLRVLNRGEGDLRRLIGEVLRLIRESTGFDAVGLRLRQGEDCPYYQQDGFSDEFLREENFLCAKGADASILRDASGEAVLECTCGVVLGGRADPSMPCFTEGGSFWTNRSPELLALAPQDDPRTNPRNRCIHAGYQSVALVPVRYGEQIIGLLQLNDRQPDRFTPGRIRFFEILTNNLGLALQRRQAEEALRESEQRFRTMADGTPMLIWVNGPKGCRFANRAYLDFLGVSSEAAVHRNDWAQFVHPDDREEYINAYLDCMKCRAPFEATFRFRRHDGMYRWMQSAASPLISGSGELLGYVGSTVDITERKRAEEELRKERALYADLVEAIPAGVYRICVPPASTLREEDWKSSLTTPYRFEMASGRFCEILGVSRQVLEGNPGIASDLVHRDDKEEFARANQNADIRLPFRWEGRLVVGGKTKWVHFESLPRPVGDGNVVWTGVLYDITDRKQAEEDLKAAKAAAEDANCAKDQFIAILSHELRTPLTPALAALSLLRRDVRLAQDVRDDLEMVGRNIELEVRLIADLLDVSRIISGKLHLEKCPVDVAVAIREAAQIVSGDLDARGQTLTIETPGAPYLTFGDAARLQQVFWNLIRNAIKFTPHQGRIAVRASVVPVDHCPLVAQPCPVGMGECPLSQASEGHGEAQGGNLIIEVSDTGGGIDPEVLPRLFAPFEQGGEGRSLGGLGLGLSICKAVVEMHGGTISARSDGPGRGATFTVRLPVAQCPVAAATDRSPPAADEAHATGGNGEPAPADRPQSIRILLVEDHADTAKLMSRLLMADGHEVMVAGSVASALAAVEQAAGKLDLLISDLGLPDGNGHDLMRQLLHEGKAIPGIALSGYGTAADIEKSKAAGFTEHLTKPTSLNLLAAAIQRVTQYHKLVSSGGGVMYRG